MAKSKKVRRLQKAAYRCRPREMYMLGLCYEHGRGIGQDTAEAVYWIGEAASLGYAPAVEWMHDYAYDDDASTQAYS